MGVAAWSPPRLSICAAVDLRVSGDPQRGYGNLSRAQRAPRCTSRVGEDGRWPSRKAVEPMARTTLRRNAVGIDERRQLVGIAVSRRMTGEPVGDRRMRVDLDDALRQPL